MNGPSDLQAPDDMRGDSRGKPAFDFLESSPYAQIAYTFDLEILAVNARHCAMTGMKPETLVGRQLFEAFPPNPDAPDANAEAPLRESVARVRETGGNDTLPTVQHDIPKLGKPGEFEQRYWQIVQSPLRGVDGTMLGILQTARDITQQMNDRAVERARRRAAEASGNLMFWEFDLDNDTSVRSPGVDEVFGFEPGEAIRFEDFAARIHPADRPDVYENAHSSLSCSPGTAFESDFRVVRPDGTVRHLNSRSEVVIYDGSRRSTGVLVDTTVIHRREDALRRMVDEKQALLSDVNHRVKNSLQLVASLLNIEQRASAGGEAARPLSRTAGRVAAIAAVHASLYHYADMSRVNVSEHLQTFCGQLSDDHAGRVVLEIEAEPLYLGAEKAVPLALLVNELVGSALDATQRTGERVLVKLEYDGPRLLLHVRNASKRPDTMLGPGGSRLFEALLEQLGARFSQDGDDGCNASLEFRRA